MQSNIRETYKDLYKVTGTSRPTAPQYKAYAKAWGWYKIIADICGCSLLDFDRITALPATQVFTFLQFTKHKEAADDAQRKLDEQLAEAKRRNKNGNS